MTEIRPAADARAADWLSREDPRWWDLVRFGPPGFEVYLRIEFGDDEESEPGIDTVRVALDTLTSCTTTPTEAYAAIWEGWCAEPPPPAPRVEIPHRAMVLFTGPVESLRGAPGFAWHGTLDDGTPPHLAWPADRAWCLACEVDEEIEFTVGCSETTARVLEAALPGRVRREVYGADAPLYLDD